MEKDVCREVLYFVPCIVF